MSEYRTPPPTRISPTSAISLQELQGASIVILCGRNNSGKTFVLRQLAKAHGQGAAYLGPQRLSNFAALGAYGPNPNRRSEKYNQLIDLLRQEGQNIDSSPFSLQQAVAEMSDEHRGKLLTLMNQLLGTHAEISKTIPDNEMSQRYISVDGFNLSFTSSGFRLIITLLASFLDEDYTAFLVDEPEMGLSPEIQGVFADFLLQEENRRKFFPHMAQIVLATHSPIFLDRVTLGNNYVIDRIGSEITIRPVTSVQELNSLQFLLLGNRFETLFLPSAILLVEGKTDHAYLSRVMAMNFPSSLLSIIHCGDDSRLRQVLNIAVQMFNDLRRSPYADRIFVVTDAVHGTGLREHLMRSGVPERNIVVWSENGIEFLYPREILEQRFGSFKELKIQDDLVGANGTWENKSALGEFVLARLTDRSELPTELIEKLIVPLRELLY
jgi:hypothetical protein